MKLVAVSLQAYETLMDEGARMKYNARLEQALQDGLDDYSGQPLSKWMPTANPKMAKNENPAENRAVFVVSHVAGVHRAVSIYTCMEAGNAGFVCH